MNWAFKFAFDEIEELFENRPWLLVDDKIQSHQNLPDEQGDSFISMQKRLMIQRGWDWFRSAIRGRFFPNLNVATVTTLEAERDPSRGDPPEVIQQVRDKFPGATLVSLIGGAHIIEGTGYVPPDILSGIVSHSQKKKWREGFEKTAMIKTADDDEPRPYFKDEFHFEISDVDRYTTDKYFANLTLQETIDKYSVGFQMYNYQVGITGAVQYWHYDKDEFSRAKKTFTAAKTALRDMMTDLEYLRPPMAIITPMIRAALHPIDIPKKERSGNYFFNWFKELPKESDWRTTLYGDRYPKSVIQPIDVSWNEDDQGKQITSEGGSSRTKVVRYRPYSPSMDKVAMDMEGLKKMLMAAWGITAVSTAGGILAYLLGLGIPPQQLEHQLQQGASPQQVMRQVLPQNEQPDALVPLENAPQTPETQEITENVGFSPEGVDNSEKPDNIEQLPRGIRNNNPGNIVRNETQWNGIADEQTDERFVTFESPEYGVRAMARVLRNYQRKHGLRTIAEILGRWSPETENNTAAYIQHVSEQLDIPPNSPLDLEDDALLARLISSIIRHENGRNFYDDQTIHEGISLEKRSSRVYRHAYKGAEWLQWKRQVLQWAQAGWSQTQIGQALAQNGVSNDVIQKLIGEVVTPFMGSAYASSNYWRHKFV